uniref:Putative product n=1 Tax=Xenopsylla cheopis TaxID=163159 RepID=A0A6M2DSA1_XENCH
MFEKKHYAVVAGSFASAASLFGKLISLVDYSSYQVLFGTFIFGETTGILWWMGFVLILIGLYVITANDSDGVKAKDA